MKSPILNLSLLVALMLAANASAAQSLRWAAPDGAPPGSDGRPTLYYVRMESAALCREVEEDVWSDLRVVNACRDLHVVWVDAGLTANQTLVTQLRVFVVPTVILMKQGNEVGRLERNRSREDHLFLLGAAPAPAATSSPIALASTQLAPSESLRLDDDPADSGGDASLDITQVTVAFRSAGLECVVHVAGAPDTARPGAYNIYLDTDGNPDTGFANEAVAGADFLVQGPVVNKFSGAAPSAWSWTPVGTARLAPQGQGMGFAVDWAALNVAPGSTLGALFETQDAAWSPRDRAPARGFFALTAGAAPAGALAPEAAPVAASRPANSPALTLTDPRGDATPAEDLVGVDVGQEGDFLRFHLEFAAAPNYNGIHVFLNPDRDPDTGFTSTHGAGADFMIEGVGLYRHDGAATEWNWSKILDLDQQRTASGIVYRVPRSRIGYPTGGDLEFWLATTDAAWADADALPDRGVALFPPR